MGDDVINDKIQFGEKIIMARKKVKVERKPMKVKRTRNITEEQREALRQRMNEMRKKRKPAEYKNIHKSVLALPDEDKYSFKNVKEWIKESKELAAQYNKQAKSSRNSPMDRQQAFTLATDKKAYIRMCEHYLKTGDWIAMFSGKNEEHKVVSKCVVMAYYPDGTPKRNVGVYYPDINMVWNKDMDESEYVTLENREYIKRETVSDTEVKQVTQNWANKETQIRQQGLEALTDKQFTGDM